MEENEIRQSVRERYGAIAKEGSSCGCTPKGKASCCDNTSSAREASKSIGYSDEEMDSVPDGANLGLGCGNPTALASLKEGETVLDLGSGGGFDCFLAANRVGAKGKVIGVDMTAEMLEKARENARKNNYTNVEFRLGEIESLPAADDSVDVIISNCVINLSPDKPRVFREAYRVLKPGGRIMVSDIVLAKALPEAIRESVAAYVGCVAGALLEKEYLGAIEAAGFKDLRVVDTASLAADTLENDPTVAGIIESVDLSEEEMKDAASSVLNIKVSAVK